MKKKSETGIKTRHEAQVPEHVPHQIEVVLLPAEAARHRISLRRGPNQARGAVTHEAKVPELPAQRSVDLPRVHVAGLAPQIVQHGLGPPALCLFLRYGRLGGVTLKLLAQALGRSRSPGRRGA